MINYFTLTEEYFKYLQKKTNGEILWNKNEKRPYGLIMEVGKIDFYVPFTHDLRINRFPFLKDASYQVPSEELEKLEEGTEIAKEAVVEIIKNGIDIAMNKFN